MNAGMASTELIAFIQFKKGACRAVDQCSL
jgi:hypothetical protein